MQKAEYSKKNRGLWFKSFAKNKKKIKIMRQHCFSACLFLRSLHSLHLHPFLLCLDVAAYLKSLHTHLPLHSFIIAHLPVLKQEHCTPGLPRATATQTTYWLTWWHFLFRHADSCQVPPVIAQQPICEEISLHFFNPHYSSKVTTPNLC